ncbi:MAG: Crp/Fnr family transcriptional regulator [Oscillospiraceae bacterium]|nr:Crp/Fnr family transcriptional regulator [Oscillospiraceae bacterium]
MNLRDFLTQAINPGTEAALDLLMKNAEVCHVKKGEILVSAGEPQTHLIYIIEGVIRGYILNEAGKEITDSFAYRYGASVRASYEFGKPSIASFKAMSNCMYLQIPVADIQASMEQLPEMMQVYINSVIAALNRQYEMKLVLYQYSALEKYLWFLKKYPGLNDAVEDKFIASFFGMNAVTLSRVRRQLREGEAMVEK